MRRTSPAGDGTRFRFMRDLAENATSRLAGYLRFRRWTWRDADPTTERAFMTVPRTIVAAAALMLFASVSGAQAQRRDGGGREGGGNGGQRAVPRAAPSRPAGAPPAAGGTPPGGAPPPAGARAGAGGPPP